MLLLKLHKWLLVAWLMLGGSTASSAADWAYNSMPQTTPSYQFQSTSSYSSGLGSSRLAPRVSAPFAASPSIGGPRRDGTYDPWSDDGDPTGYEIGQVDTPIGDDLPLILFALLALGVIIYRKWTDIGPRLHRH